MTRSAGILIVSDDRGRVHPAAFGMLVMLIGLIAVAVLTIVFVLPEVTMP